MHNAATHVLEQHDEQAIRTLFAAWQHATADGDLTQLLKLMDDDVIFLTPGQPPMCGKSSFAAAFQTVLQQYHIDSQGHLKEVSVSADVAFCWSYLTVTVTALHGGSSAVRAGDTLTLLRKRSDGTWVIFRDANMLTLVDPAPLIR